MHHPTPGQGNRLEDLNPAQREAACFNESPALLIIAGAGSGKTMTLAHRVAQLVLQGVDPTRIMLLTFTRRAAQEMAHRADVIVAATLAASGSKKPAPLSWAGTFHSVGSRLLRRYAQHVGLDPAFTVLDRADAEDLIDLLRHERGLSEKQRRFPKKGTCLAIYSRCVNTQASLRVCLETAFPWCLEWEEPLRELFRQYVESKQARHLLDYDDLLLWWWHLVSDASLAAMLGADFDHILVDEYQDTNALQAQIVRALKPTGTGITVVGDDAQSIYSFRAANVRNILDFPKQFDPPARVITLDENYRSTQSILDAANSVISLAKERYAKELFSRREVGHKPNLVCVEDEKDQAKYVADQILARREEGMSLKRQSVLFRVSHASDLLEVELARRDIPFVKYGGLRFLESAHIKDLLAVLRWATNPRDTVAGFRVLQLVEGVGPKIARRTLVELEREDFRLAALKTITRAGVAANDVGTLCDVLVGIHESGDAWPGDVSAARKWYSPQLERLYDNAAQRVGDLEQLEVAASQYASRERFLTELTLDPPESTGNLAADPFLDEDYVTLSTIHSAKGQEWDAVYVLNVVDGQMPSDMAVGSPEEIEEERRLLYVAMTRARRTLDLIHPLRFYVTNQPKRGDRHMYAPLSRFLPEQTHGYFNRVAPQNGAQSPRPATPATTIDVGSRLLRMW